MNSREDEEDFHLLRSNAESPPTLDNRQSSANLHLPSADEDIPVDTATTIGDTLFIIDQNTDSDGSMVVYNHPPPWRPLLEDYSSAEEDALEMNTSAENIVIQVAVQAHMRQSSLEHARVRQALMDQLWATGNDSEDVENEEGNREEQEEEEENIDDVDDDDDERDLDPPEFIPPLRGPTLGLWSPTRGLPRPQTAWPPAEISATERIENDLTIQERILTISQNYDYEEIIINQQPGNIYSEPLKLQYRGAQNLDILDFPSFRNNLTVASKLHDALFLANGSTVSMYKVDEPSKILESTSVFSFETKPDATLTHMIVGANWMNVPHFINYMTTGVMNGAEYLITAADDGRVIVFCVAQLVKRYNGALKANEETPSDSRPSVIGKVIPLGTFQMSSSAWGLAVHERLQLIAVSCNTAKVTILDLKELVNGRSNTVIHYVSPRLRHNIPDVTFIDPSPEDIAKGMFRDDAFYVSCCSIAGDVVVWEFFTGKRLEKFYELTNGQTTYNSVQPLLMNETASVMTFPDEEQDAVFLRIPFDGGRWLVHRDTEEEGWTVNTVCEQDFKEVHSFYELSGSEWLNENNVFRQMSTPLHAKYPIPGLNRDDLGQVIPLDQQFFAFAMRFVHFSVVTTSVRDFDLHSRVEGHRTTRIDQQTLHLDKQRHALTDFYISNRNKNDSPTPTKASYTQRLLRNPPLSNRFMILTSKKSLYLCRAENLLCNASIPDVFRRESYVSSDSAAFDRMNIIKVIPGLSAIVVASQLGSIAIFRLVRYKSLFTIRQEYVFPVHEMLIHRTPVLRTIVGVAVTPVYESDQNPITTDPHSIRSHRLTIIYKDGFMLTYNMSRPAHDIISNLVF